MQDIFIKELFWLIIGSFLSLILTFIFLGLLELTSANLEMNEVEKVFSVQLYIIGCFVSLISIYIVRVVVNATKKYIIK